MGLWRPVHDGTGWIVAKTDFLGRIVETKGGYCSSKETAKIMAQQYNMGL